ncbi:Late transcription factor VLTF-4 (1), partial [Monkeypox virus]
SKVVRKKVKTCK